VNASAIPETLLESQMFGHARGAFTGATQAHRGMFAEADGGTLVLDEIGDMPLPLQAKLLRVLQSGEIRPVGGDRTSYVDVRVIAATHRSLTALVREGKFRDDLFYRLNVVTVVLPPLRARASDIPELATYFLDSARQRAPESPARSLAPELVDALVQASWPGNVRELESVIERLVVLATHAELTLADLGVQLDDGEGATSTKREPSDPSLEGLIQDHVERILERTGGNKALAAKMLGIDLSTLYRWQRKWSS
jgi:transcriptional regulator with PAS, ATPase and Fis domain